MSRTLKKRDGDLVFSASNGRQPLVHGVEKLSQDVADALMTEYDPVRAFGSQAASLDTINERNLSGPLGSISRGIIKSFIREALERLRSLQKLRGSNIDPFETIKDIGTVRVIQFSKTGYMSNVNVVPEAGPDVNTSTFLIQLRHQFLSSNKPNLPGSVITDDVSPL